MRTLDLPDLILDLAGSAQDCETCPIQENPVLARSRTYDASCHAIMNESEAWNDRPATCPGLLRSGIGGSWTHSLRVTRQNFSTKSRCSSVLLPFNLLHLQVACQSFDYNNILVLLHLSCKANLQSSDKSLWMHPLSVDAWHITQRT